MDSDADETRSGGTGTDEGRHESIWLSTTPGTDYEALEGGLEVDCAVVGGGIAGLTTALRLARHDFSVAVVERDRVAAGVTGHSTAKLTSQHGLVYDRLVDDFGRRRARLYGEANEAAIDTVESLAEDYDIDNEFERTSAYTYTTDPDERRAIGDEVKAARDVGLPADYTESTDLPYDDEVVAAVRFDDQAQFDPRSHVLGLAEAVVEEGGHVFEETAATDVEDGGRPRVVTERGTVTANSVVVATHFPFFDHGLYFARLTPKKSYVLAARLDGDVPEGMYYRSGDSYFSVRPRPAGRDDVALLGGQNHRTGHGGDVADRYRALEREARERFDVASIEYRWSTQDFTSVDGVPFVGQLAPQTRDVYVATGFGGWGLSNGTAAGVVLADLIRGRRRDWLDVYTPTRLKPAASARSLVSHNKHATKHFVKDQLGRLSAGASESSRAVDVDPGEGRVVERDGDKIAAYRDDDGDLHAVSAVCTHLDCTVAWNDGDLTWDCPCHGSRFDVDGTVIDGPAVEDLPTRDPE